MGRDDPYRRRPWFIGSAPMSEVDNTWVIQVICHNCRRIGVLGRVRDIPGALTCKTQGEFVARLTCSACGAKHASVTVEFVGLRRD